MFMAWKPTNSFLTPLRMITDNLVHLWNLSMTVHRSKLATECLTSYVPWFLEPGKLSFITNIKTSHIVVGKISSASPILSCIEPSLHHINAYWPWYTHALCAITLHLLHWWAKPHLKCIQDQLSTLVQSYDSHGGLPCTILLKKQPPLYRTLLKGLADWLVLLSMLAMLWPLKSSPRTPSWLFTILVSIPPLILRQLVYMLMMSALILVTCILTLISTLCLHSQRFALDMILLMGSILTSFCLLPSQWFDWQNFPQGSQEDGQKSCQDHRHR